jgi:hypothetical protein
MPSDSGVLRQPAQPPLHDEDRDLLEFEAEHPAHSRAKEDAIRARFGYSAARYYQILGTLIESPSALVAYPMLVHRLRRMREARRAHRFGTIDGRN